MKESMIGQLVELADDLDLQILYLNMMHQEKVDIVAENWGFTIPGDSWLVTTPLAVIGDMANLNDTVTLLWQGQRGWMVAPSIELRKKLENKGDEDNDM